MRATKPPKYFSVRALLLLACVYPGNIVSAQHQGSPEWGRTIPGCARAYCAEQTAYVAALDALLRESPACRARPPAILRTIHLSPYTAFGDALNGRERPHPGLPTSPAVMRIDDVWNPFFRYWEAITIVDAEDVEHGAVAPERCLFVFSPVTWLTPDSVRVIVSESRLSPREVKQQYVFLSRTAGRWAIDRIEVGLQT